MSDEDDELDSNTFTIDPTLDSRILEDKENSKKKRKCCIITLFVVILFLIVIVIGLYLAIFQLKLFGKKDNTLKSTRCQEGERENCAKCNKTTDICESCNEGYYLPENDLEKIKCEKCSVEHCSICKGEILSDICLSCGDFPPIYQNNQIIECNFTCIIGEEEKCASCDEINKDQCSKCNNGFYIPDDDSIKRKCQKCTIENCQSCKGTKNLDECISCGHHTPIYKDDKIISCEYTCEEGEKEKCKSCDKEKNVCTSCNPGYYIPNDDKDINICEKCSAENCTECNGDKNKDICTSCGYYSPYIINNKIVSCNFTCETGDGEKCQICDEEKNRCKTCNNGYFLPEDDEKKEKCQKCNIDNCAICEGTKNSNVCTSCGYFDPIYNDKNEIINCNYTCETGDKEKCLTCDEEKNRCETCNKGYYIPKDDETIKTCLKCSIPYCKECYWSEDIKSDICISCGYLTPIYENDQIISCNYTCEEGDKEKCQTCDEEKNICSSCNPGYYIPDGEENLQICDKCSIENCEICNGTKSLDTCIYCSDYVPIYNDENMITNCVSICTEGEKEKCKKCDEEKIRCQECNNGYYIPLDDMSIKNCFECSVKDCVNCVGGLGGDICTSCGYLTPIYENKEIISCNYTSEEGEKEKCLTCDKEKNRCLACNPSYILVNGKCYFDCSITAIYKTNEKDEKIEIINSLYIDSIAEIKIDDKNENPCSNYTFPEPGEHIIFYNMDISNLTSLNSMFKGVNKMISISFSNSFNTSKITDMNSMFNGCKSLTSLDISFFNTENIKDLSYMFYECNSLKSLDISNFKTPNIKKIEYLFYYCSSLTSLDISNFDTSKVDDMQSLFFRCGSLISLDISNFDTANVINMNSIFSGCYSLSSLNILNLKTDKVYEMTRMFFNCTSLTSLDVSNLNTSRVVYMALMFSNCKSLVSLDLSNFITSKVMYMNNMFYGCKSLKSLDISNFDTSRVINMEFMFGVCSVLEEINLKSFDTSLVTHMGNMFQHCVSLTSIDISHFNVKKVMYIDYMFHGCLNLQSIDLSKWETPSLNSLAHMFYDCNKLANIDISKFTCSSKVLISTQIFNELPETGKIKVNKDFLEKIKEQIPSKWEIDSS